MTEKSLVGKPPIGLLRLALRMPLLLYRFRMGWLLDGRFVLLNHIGRKTGQAHKTVVEVLGHANASDTYYIISGWGYKANWYQNLRTTPDITIQIGRRHLDVHVETVSAKEGAQLLIDYRDKHPFAARELSSIMGLNLFEASPEILEATVQKSLPVLALRPRLS